MVYRANLQRHLTNTVLDRSKRHGTVNASPTHSSPLSQLAFVMAGPDRHGPFTDYHSPADRELSASRNPVPSKDASKARGSQCQNGGSHPVEAPVYKRTGLFRRLKQINTAIQGEAATKPLRLITNQLPWHREGNEQKRRDEPVDESPSLSPVDRRCVVEIHKMRLRKELAEMLTSPAGQGGPLNGETSPRTAQNPIDAAPFPLLWEHCILPFLLEFLPKWSSPLHSLTVLRGTPPPARRICIMTREPVTPSTRDLISHHVRSLLPCSLRDSTTFEFSEGKVERLRWSRGLNERLLDEICAPRNPFKFENPCMGDSIGVRGSRGADDTAATLGPRIVVGGRSYWLANLHPFLEAGKGAEVQHPSPIDRQACIGKGHRSFVPRQDSDFMLGKLVHASGRDHRTTCLSSEPYWTRIRHCREPVVTDWSLIEASARGPNRLRTLPPLSHSPHPSHSHHPYPHPNLNPTVTEIAHVEPGAEVLSCGRTSGLQHGTICEIPAWLTGDEHGNSTGTPTREWFIQAPDPLADDNEWIKGGIGVEGDSGAGVVDARTGRLVGQLWGRNRYWGQGERVTYFTPIRDVLGDVGEKCGSREVTGLPGAGEGEGEGEGEVGSGMEYPTCRECYEDVILESRCSYEASLSVCPGTESEGTQTPTEDIPLTPVYQTYPREKTPVVPHEALTPRTSIDTPKARIRRPHHWQQLPETPQRSSRRLTPEDRWQLCIQAPAEAWDELARAGYQLNVQIPSVLWKELASPGSQWRLSVQTPARW